MLVHLGAFCHDYFARLTTILHIWKYILPPPSLQCITQVRAPSQKFVIFLFLLQAQLLFSDYCLVCCSSSCLPKLFSHTITHWKVRFIFVSENLVCISCVQMDDNKKINKHVLKENSSRWKWLCLWGCLLVS